MLFRQKRWLIRLFEKIARLQEAPLERRLLALEIQETLLHRMSRAEWLIRKVRTENKELKRDLAIRRGTRESSKEIKARYAANNARLEEQEDLISILRSMGDSIPFIYGDRWDLKQMRLKEEPGFLTGKKGTRLERKILREAFRRGATVVMNDLTHTMRFGDITFFFPEIWPEGGGPFRWIEVKSGRGGDAARTARQMSASKHIGEYLSTDRREADGGLYQRVALATELVHHSDAATRLMMDLPRAGWLREEVEPGLHYVLIDCERNQENYEEIFGCILARGTPLLLSVNDMKRQTLAYYPFPLSIRNPEALFRFFNGEFVMYVVVDLDEVNRQVSKKSMVITLSGRLEYPLKVTLEDHELPSELRESYVGFHPIGRLAAEFVGLSWLVENLLSASVREFVDRYLNGVSVLRPER